MGFIVGFVLFWLVGGFFVVVFVSLLLFFLEPRQMTTVVNLFIVVAGMVIVVSLVKSTFPDFLPSYLNLDYLLALYIYPDTLQCLYDSVIAEFFFFFF